MKLSTQAQNVYSKSRNTFYLLLITACLTLSMPLTAKQRPSLTQDEAEYIRQRQNAAEKRCQYYFSVFAIFQNEARWMKEWIEFYRMMGAEHFYLVNNESTDHYREVLAPYIDNGEVDLFDWPGEFIRLQGKMVSDMIHHCSGKTRWLASIDLDEIIVPYGYDSIVQCLEDLEDYHQVDIRWKIFGTSGVKKVPEDRLMVETLTRCSPWGSKRPLGKVIVKPHCVHRPNCHHSTLNPGVGNQTFYTNPKMEIAEPILQCNHYWSRDEDWLLNVKRPRREHYEKRVWTEAFLQKVLNFNNKIEDLRIQRWVPELRQRVFGIDALAADEPSDGI